MKIFSSRNLCLQITKPNSINQYWLFYKEDLVKTGFEANYQRLLNLDKILIMLIIGLMSILHNKIILMNYTLKSLLKQYVKF